MNSSHDVLHPYLYIMIIIESKGAKRAVLLDLLMMVLIINLKRGES
jgi:hypothetical protein